MWDKKIIVLEDNPADFQLTKLALNETGLSENIVHFESGETFIKCLNLLEKNDFSFLLLDLNLPGLNGFEILNILRSSFIQKLDIPVVVFTTSNDKDHLQKCYELGADAYIVKPLDINDYFAVIKKITDFWFHRNLAPAV